MAEAIFSKAGVNRSIEVSSPDGKPLSQAQIAWYKFGDAQILAIVKENVAVAGVVGQDGVTTYNDANLGQVAKQEVIVKLPGKMYVTDVRSGKQLGYTDVVHTSILIGDALVFGLSSKQNKINLDGPTAVERGAHVHFKVNSNESTVALVRCHVFAPDGTRLPVYSSNILVQSGNGSFTLPFALNDAKGKYVVRATDVVTGATVEKTVEVK